MGAAIAIGAPVFDKAGRPAPGMSRKDKRDSMAGSLNSREGL
jgi:hypothetical protein